MKRSGRIVSVDRTTLVCAPAMPGLPDRYIKNALPAKGPIVILVDTNTKELCLPVLREYSSLATSAFILEINPGEASKTLETAAQLWNRMLEEGFGRDTLLVTLGGGVVSDLGGFVAAGFKRGIPCIHIPTSLVAMVDAAIGGKTGVNLGGIKNQVGFFHLPASVLAFPVFLGTLPRAELRSGMAELVKTALVGDRQFWNRLRRGGLQQVMDTPPAEKSWIDLVFKAMSIKSAMVRQDYRERNIRKKLNFGHTIGHALEAFSHREGRLPLRHGDAVAAGMIGAAYLSNLKTGLPAADLDAITGYLAVGWESFRFGKSDYPELMGYMKQDKKNRDGRILFTLLEEPGEARINVACSEEEIAAALDYYCSCAKGEGA
jgi:3-dehydroquinate synthase